MVLGSFLSAGDNGSADSYLFAVPMAFLVGLLAINGHVSYQQWSWVCSGGGSGSQGISGKGHVLVRQYGLGRGHHWFRVHGLLSTESWNRVNLLYGCLPDRDCDDLVDSDPAGKAWGDASVTSDYPEWELPRMTSQSLTFWERA